MTKLYKALAFDFPFDEPGRGSCFVSDRITVDGAPVGYMYREDPDNEIDSGWRFLAGDESQDYINNPDNLAIFEVNQIAKHDPDIVALLSAPSGSAFERTEDGHFESVPFDLRNEDLH